MAVRIRIILALLGLSVAAAACAGASRPPLADTWGLSVRMAIENQKLDPTPKGDRAVTGLDPVFARNGLEAYRKSAEPDANGGQDKLPEAIILSKKGGQR